MVSPKFLADLRKEAHPDCVRGDRNNAPVCQLQHGGVGEIIFTDGSEDLATQQKTEGYLAHKWGLEGKLPTGHPHKATPPGITGVIVNLDGTVTDEDEDPFTTTWSVPVGTGSVSFGDSTAVDTTATFTAVGTYVLTLTANDGFDTILDEVTITVNASSPLYTTWASTFGAGFTDTDPSSDQDGDGLTNQQEFAFGTDPTVNDGGPMSVDGSVHGMPVPISTDGGVSYDLYFMRRTDHATSGSIIYTPQFSSDLTDFAASTGPLTVMPSVAGPDYEVVKVPYPTGNTFGRVKTEAKP